MSVRMYVLNVLQLTGIPGTEDCDAVSSRIDEIGIKEFLVQCFPDRTQLKLSAKCRSLHGHYISGEQSCNVIYYKLIFQDKVSLQTTMAALDHMGAEANIHDCPGTSIYTWTGGYKNMESKYKFQCGK